MAWRLRAKLPDTWEQVNLRVLLLVRETSYWRKKFESRFAGVLHPRDDQDEQLCFSQHLERFQIDINTYHINDANYTWNQIFKLDALLYLHQCLLLFPCPALSTPFATLLVPSSRPVAAPPSPSPMGLPALPVVAVIVSPMPRPAAPATPPVTIQIHVSWDVAVGSGGKPRHVEFVTQTSVEVKSERNAYRQCERVRR